MSIAWIPALVAFLSAVVIVAIQFYLSERANTRVERLKSELLQLADRRRSLFDRRANVLVTVYAKLFEAHEAFQDFLNSGTRFASQPGPEERHRAAVESGEQFRKAFERARILIPDSVTTLLDQLNREFVSINRTFVVWRSSGEDENEALIRVYQETEGTIQTAMRDVEKAFRQAIDEP